MYKLFIKNPDGSIYWTENFNSEIDRNAWLTEEKTRSYWNPAFTTEFQTDEVSLEISEQEKINEDALAYLSSTDWMVIRASEDPTKPIPDDVKAKRQESRNKIVK